MNRTSMVIAGQHLEVPAGTWRLDPAHTSVTFSVRHLMSKVRGRFSDVEGRIVVGATPETSSVEASIATTSVDTGTHMRDNDLRSSNFFDVDRFPSMTFSSTAVSAAESGLTLLGDLTIRDVTLPVSIDVEFLGFDEEGLQGEPRMGFSGRTTVRRSDFKVGDSAVEGSKIVVGDSITVELDVEVFLEQ